MADPISGGKCELIVPELFYAGVETINHETVPNIWEGDVPASNKLHRKAIDIALAEVGVPEDIKLEEWLTLAANGMDDEGLEGQAERVQARIITGEDFKAKAAQLVKDGRRPEDNPLIKFLRSPEVCQVAQQRLDQAVERVPEIQETLNGIERTGVASVFVGFLGVIYSMGSSAEASKLRFFGSMAGGATLITFTAVIWTFDKEITEWIRN
ncbi:MAG: hypothetical protein KDK66_00180 [Deltaproteobacteria bacterium]|nr:hypothetical protein [Deltaproteobacteria bacterium]